MPGIVVIAIAFLIGAMGGIFSKVPNQRITRGEIVSTRFSYDSTDRKQIFIASISYVVNSREYTLECKTLPTSYKVGKKVKLAYNSEYPEQAKVRPTLSVYLLMLIVSVAGIIIAFKTF